MAGELEAMARDREADAAAVEERLRLMLVPRDPNDEKDVIIEVRAAAGGDEAGIWAGDLFRMYQRYAERHRWVVEQLTSSPADSGGFKEVIFAVKGRGAYSRLKFEAGPHRVQRVPRTESQGRIHTSIATVAVLPEVEEVEVQIAENDLQIDVFRSTGPGGQSVNTTDSAVRITHKPTGLVVTCQDEKSQLQNKAKALRVLRARLYQIEADRRHAAQAADRRSQVGTGERAEKIRTYNYRENRVTDHRIGLTIKRLPEILEGDLDEFVDALTQDERRSSAGAWPSGRGLPPRRPPFSLFPTSSRIPPCPLRRSLSAWTTTWWPPPGAGWAAEGCRATSTRRCGVVCSAIGWWSCWARWRRRPGPVDPAILEEVRRAWPAPDGPPPSLLILDSGAVIALSRGDARARAFLQRAVELEAWVEVPVVVLAETTRGTNRDAAVNRVAEGGRGGARHAGEGGPEGRGAARGRPGARVASMRWWSPTPWRPEAASSSPPTPMIWASWQRATPGSGSSGS